MKLDTGQRLLMCNMLSGTLPLYIVTEYPKSGGTWVSQMISAYLGLPFPRNIRPKLESCIMHGHMLPTPFMKNVVCLFRDGRDIMVSSYFHMLFQNDRNPPIMVQRTRAALSFEDYEDVRANLPRFIEYVFETRQKSLNPNKFTWNQFVNKWMRTSVCKVKYEDMVADGSRVLAQTLQQLTGRNVDHEKVERIIEEYSFENQTSRRPGEEDASSFLRKGKPGDWKEKFTREAAEVFDSYAGKELIKLGYEKDSSWVSGL